jgi:crotonobetainyl-CoA:carnitine CoA-transferase CaiB-like acyl-CoA transferase
LDMSQGIAGQYCGKLLAGFGASTTLVEPPEGTPTRWLGPMLSSGELTTRSTLFRHLNQAKSSAVVDLTTREGWESVASMARLADVVIRDSSRNLEFDLEPATVECVIGEFPDDGPYRMWRGSEMVHQAMSGTMFVTGHAARRPLYGLGHRAYYACGTTACISVLAALHERSSSGIGQRVRATVFESAAAIGQNLVSQYSYSRTFETRAREPGSLALLKCRDHWLVLFAVRHWEELCKVFDLEHLLSDERLANQAGRLEHWREVTDELQTKARERSAAELVEALQHARISAEIVAPLAELAKSPQWKIRRILRTVSDGEGRTETTLGPPFAVGTTPYVGTQLSPLLMTDVGGLRAAGEISAEWAATKINEQKTHGSPNSSRLAGPRVSSPSHLTSDGSLAGLRVIDLTTAWAGPFAARSLAYLGAHVIKIDAPSHMDSWRGALEGGRREWYPDMDPGSRPWNRCVLFNTQGQGKWSLGLDLKVDGARDVILKLAEGSDVVIANFTPGVLERLGIGYETLSKVNPRIIVVEMPAFGPGGPDSRHQGMGKTMEAAAGMAAHMGYGDGIPVLTGPNYLDPIGGLNAVAATLIALYRRERSDQGCRVEVPQTEAGLHWIGEHVLHQSESAETWAPNGNMVPYAAPHDAYPCEGDDEWIAIAVGDDRQWVTLCELMERSDMAQSSRFASLHGRLEHHDELSILLSEWTIRFNKHDLAQRLQAAGVAAAPVTTGADVASDPALHASGFIQQLSHPEAGSHDYPTLSFLLSRTPGGVSSAAPCFGEHNDLVLRTILGLPESVTEGLVQSGAVTNSPIVPQTTAVSMKAQAPRSHSETAGDTTSDAENAI